ncbi:MAG: indolepyruvate ferredoxin oxidoreductase, alpha subunit [Myxococcales bacterium]|nr:indolepyruvate ferredoxin oxidoreductase, alpha subunit [Myxococcales bacterium]
MLTGHEALARALAAARIRSAWSFPGAPLTKTQLLLEARGAGVSHHFTVNEHVAASMALGGALLSGHGTAAMMKHVGVNVALDTLATFGMVNELRSPALFVEGLDPGPSAAQNAQDNRAALSQVAQLVQLEAGSADETYQLVRLGAHASQRSGMPVLVRLHPRYLEARAAVHEAPPDLPEGALMMFSRAAGPFISTSATYRYHAEKRSRRLARLLPLVEALVCKTLGDSSHAVVLSGTLGPMAHARAWARRLSTVRLGAAWPLPRQALLELMQGRDEVLVLEEGEPFLERELQAFAHRESLQCRVRGAGESRPQRLDDERIDTLLGRFGGRVRAEADAVVRTAAEWKAAEDAAAAIGEDDGEPWPLFVARTRGKMKGFVANDPRATLLQSLRQLDRPTIIVSGPGPTGVLGIRDRLVDVKMHMGSAAPVAGALADAGEVEEQSGAPLAVALIGDVSHYHSELLGIVDNAVARREVLHVLVVMKRTEGPKTPALPDDALEAQLRAAGLHVATAPLDDPGLGAAVAYSASRHGPRALICYGTARGVEEADG